MWPVSILLKPPHRGLIGGVHGLDPLPTPGLTVQWGRGGQFQLCSWGGGDQRLSLPPPACFLLSTRRDWPNLVPGSSVQREEEVRGPSLRSAGLYLKEGARLPQQVWLHHQQGQNSQGPSLFPAAVTMLLLSEHQFLCSGFGSASFRL